MLKSRCGAVRDGKHIQPFAKFLLKIYIHFSIDVFLGIFFLNAKGYLSSYLTEIVVAQKIVQKVVQSNEGSTLSISPANISHLAIAFPSVRQKHWKAFGQKFGAFPCNMARDSVGSKFKKIKKQCIAAGKWHCKLTTLYSISLLTWVVDGSTGFCQRKCVTWLRTSFGT